MKGLGAGAGDGGHVSMTREIRTYVAALAVLGLVGYLADFLIHTVPAFEHRALPGRPLPWIILLGNTVGLVFSLVLLGLALRRRIWLPRLITTALVMEIVVCLFITMEWAWRSAVLARPLTPMSWVTIVILVFPLIIPASPLRTFLASLACALPIPIAMLVLNVRDQLHAESVHQINALIPPFVAVVGATLGSLRVTGVSNRFGNYKTVKLVGSGGRGEVWRATHRFVEKKAAIKLIKPNLLHGVPVARRREIHDDFFREANLVSQLTCHQTVNLYDFGISGDGTLYFVMEFIDGLTLGQLVDRHGPLPPARVKRVLYDLLEPLAEAHGRHWVDAQGNLQAGVIHRDIKPGNVFLFVEGTYFDSVRVVDWGIAFLDGPIEAKGTPGFMAPEQIAGTAADARTDIYALGCLLYWLLTGHYVFSGTAKQMLERHRGEERPVPPSLRVIEEPHPVRPVEWKIPSCMDDLVLACLEKEPDRRPQAIDDVVRLIDACDVGDWSHEDAQNWWSRYESRHHPASGA